MLRFYMTFLRRRGSFLWASYLQDPETIKEMLDMPADEWNKVHPPDLFGWDPIVDKLTDIGDQLIASRASGDKVKFYPRPEVPAAKLRVERNVKKRDTGIDAARSRNQSRRGL